MSCKLRLFVVILVYSTSCAPPLETPESASLLFGKDPKLFQARDADREVIALGRKLFHDRRLSTPEARSCASCHDVHERFGQNGASARGHAADAPEDRRRDVPSLVDAGRLAIHGWNGEYATLESAVRAALGDSAKTEQIDAIAAYLRTLRSYGRWDRFLDGDEDALSHEERLGLETFTTVGCAACHGSRLLGGKTLHALPEPVSPDDAHTELRYRAPPLRLVAHTAPYFHDGSAATLEDAIRVMGRKALGKQLTPTQVTSIRKFLEAVGDIDR